MFQTYSTLGFDHILDINAYDHILFIIALSAVYYVKDWKKILVLVTAFTIGHSVTLALSALKIVVFSPDVIEFLIPLTIFVTALMNVLLDHDSNKMVRLNYFLALFFGFIHGLGISNYFKALLGAEDSIVGPLLSFNLGVELAQIIVVAVTVLLGYLVVDIFKAKHRDWNLFVSGAAAGVALMLMLNILTGN